MSYINEGLEKRLNELKFTKYEDILVGDILHYALYEKVSTKDMFKAIIKILRNNFVESYEYQVVGTPCIIFLFSNSCKGRKDHLDAFNKVASTANNYVKITPRKYVLASGLHSLNLVKSWIRQFWVEGVGIRRAVYLSNILQQAYCEYFRVNRFIENKCLNIKHAVTVCDVMPIDSYFVQKWNMNKINTITLQHGTFSVGNYAYTHSKSNIFLAHSQFSYNSAISSGVSMKKLIIVGAPQNINAQQKIENKKKKVLGLIFGGTIHQDDDMELLAFAKKFAQKYGYKIYIKMHPAFGVNRYRQNVKNGVDKIFETEVNAYEFADMVDITIDSGSTLFIEYTVQGRKTLTYLSNMNPYKDDENIEFGFKTYEEMEGFILKSEEENESFEEKRRHNMSYLGTQIDPFDNYKVFFEKLEKQ